MAAYESFKDPVIDLFDNNDNMMEKNKGQDLTQGPIHSKLIRFAIPLLLSSLVQQLYNTVDLVFAGNALGQDASSAVGLCALFAGCIVLFFSGMAVGTGVVVAHAYGEGDQAQLKTAIQNIIILSVSGGILLTVLGYLFAPYYLELIDAPEKLIPSAVRYLRTYVFSFVPIFTYNIGSGALRALGNSKLPLIAQFVGGLTHIAMDALFILGIDVGIHGMGWASLISQSTAAIIVLYHLRRLDPSYALRFSEIRFDRKILWKILSIGIPTGIQSFIISLSNILAQYQINSLGDDALAAFTAYFKVEQIVYLPIVALGQAGMTFVGQNIGASQRRRAEDGIKVCLKIGLILTVLLSAVSLFCGPYLFRAFSTEADVIELGVQIIHITFPFYFFYVFLQVLSDGMRGAGIVYAPTLITIFNFCVVRISFLFWLVPKYQCVQAAAVTYPLVWAITALCQIIYFWRKRREVFE